MKRSEHDSLTTGKREPAAMGLTEKVHLNSFMQNSRILTGVTLISIGASVLIDHYSQTRWLVFWVLLAVGALNLTAGVQMKKIGAIVAGAVLATLGLAGMLVLFFVNDYSVTERLGLGLLVVALGWFLIPAITAAAIKRPALWALVPAGVLGALGAWLFFKPLDLVSFALYMGAGLGMALLGWGVYSRLFGLIIPGCLLLGIGPGIYMAWGNMSAAAGWLVQTGVMLVWFSLGWGLIILFSRVVTARFVWWPLIPGGVLAVTGWGLYIGGNPGGAISFIGNSGSIGLIIFGVYLVLFRRGIQK